ncbi:MAG: proline--tRNA ligase [Elusimicrobiaceae bacterium]|nr:proline--tRNA ligase [Elusimicrobiaceae bacterium]
MKLSQYFLPTLREAPQDADTVSAALMLRAGLIRKLASGIYEWLPAGMRTLKKVEQIVREEMNRAGGQEVWLPVIQPKELWVETARWNVYGKELLRITDRKDAEFCFAPTAEEVITAMVRGDVRSYRQLPLVLYQFGEKFRDEIRPRFGVMRAREFYMKDAYSFHATEESANEIYGKMFEAYNSICKRCGFDYAPVEADSGAIGGNFSHEFMVIAETGENAIAYCACGYAANTEKAEVAAPSEAAPEGEPKPLKDLDTPGVTTIGEVAEFLKAKPKKFIKALLYLADGEPVMVLMRGDHQLNEFKLVRTLKCAALEKAPETVYQAVAGCAVGFAGPVDIRARFTPADGAKTPLKLLIADNHVKTMINGIAGANATDKHTVNVNPGRDFEPDGYYDLKEAAENDPCPKCGAPLKLKRGIEVGHTFKLGTRYSAPMKCEFVDENQQSRPMIMGCYGIGVSRIVAAAIEQCHDKNGIIWPAPLAPFDISLISISTPDTPEVEVEAGRIYGLVHQAGLTALWDDRDERPGVKFKDADLLGLPVRIVVSSKTLKDGEVEFKRRTEEGFGARWKLAELAAKLAELRRSV